MDKLSLFINALTILGAVVSAASDIYKRKVFNFVTFPMVIMGVLLNAMNTGLAGVYLSFTGILAGFLLYIIFYLTKIMGAGDVKLLMGFGALLGWKYAINVGILSIMLGGIMSLVVLVLTGKIINTGKEVFKFFRSILIRELEITLPKFDNKFKIPFAVAMAIAAIYIIITKNTFI